ncbi:GNAT family N-acetyltransferase [Kytococcus sedentarius]|uniref:GNAT family N-acetyltransferase n=1 Tax=Kytococcus sedentarius TaxID=1276 RepID=UPI00195181A3|nr:GNAT family N-acetyltransferase [Kytococcus sedentarius]QRO86718.1 GNAT family N-acetyltransferase [Kytococcus sedentarius]
MKIVSTDRAKRLMDLGLLVVAAPLAAPIGLATAAVVRRKMGSPVLFRQRRLGLDGREFDVLKFRSMTDERDGAGNLLPDAERLHTVGKFLRKTSLDEIPQLLNVLRGEMSFVGPRPLFPRYAAFYTPREMLRHSVRPGITGLAQVSGRNGLGWHERLALDAQYAAARSVWGDLRILALTALQTIRSEGVSVVAGDSGDPLDVERRHPRDEDLQLRRLYRRDLPLRVQWMNNPETARHMNLPPDVTLDSTVEWYEAIQANRLRHEFAVERADGLVVAMTGLRAPAEGEDAEFYTFVNPQHYGEGYGSRSTDLTLRWLDECGQYPGATLTVARNNVNALRIYRQRGFVVTRESADRLWMRRRRNPSGAANA